MTIGIPKNQVLPDRLEIAIAALTEAAEYAERATANRWDFAVEVEQLRELGITNSDLRYLVTLHYVEHAAEATKAGSHSRHFRREADLSITNKSCFVLSDSKRDAVSTFERVKLVLRPVANPKTDQNTTKVPSWDAMRRVLIFENRVVKQFKRQAINQEVILSAFQEDEWPTRIDDPLTPQPAIDEKRRLNDTIKSLNRNQLSSLIRFHGDGSGQAILWET